MNKIAEYRDIHDQPHSKRVVLASGEGAFGRRRELHHVTEGWAAAGSMARWETDHYASASFDRDGTRHSRAFRTEAEARADFEAYTTPIVECR